MSSDETDSERTPLRAKVVRRIPKVWVNASISELWNAVEKYGTGKGYKAGNAPYTRIFEPSFAAPTLQRMSQQKCVPGLPSNYYCDLWWRGLSKTQQAMIDRQTPRELPSHVSCLVYLVATVGSLMLHRSAYQANINETMPVGTTPMYQHLTPYTPCPCFRLYITPRHPCK